MVVSANNVFCKKSIVKEGGEIMKKIHAEVRKLVVVNTIGTQINQKVQELHKVYGLLNSPAESYQYPGYCCISINDCICHGCPDSTAFKHGDLVSVDIFYEYKGYCIDCCRTYIVIDPSKNLSLEDKRNIKLIEYNMDLLNHSICDVNERLKKGLSVKYSAFGNAMYKMIVDSNYCVSHEYGGHTIGKVLHDGIFVSSSINYEGSIIKEGDTFCVEPIISHSINGEVHLETYIERKWYVKNKTGRKASHWENTYTMEDNKIIQIT